MWVDWWRLEDGKEGPEKKKSLEQKMAECRGRILSYKDALKHDRSDESREKLTKKLKREEGWLKNREAELNE